MKNLQEFILFLKPSSYQDNDLEDNLDNEVYLWYEDFLKDEDNLDNEVFCDTKALLSTKTILTMKSSVIRRLRWRRRCSCQWSLSVIRRLFFDNLDNEIYLWYEDFLKDEDILVNEVYLWYEDFLDNLDNEVYLWYEDFLEDEDVLVNEVYLWYENFLEDEDILVNEVYLWYEDFQRWRRSCQRSLSVIRRLP